ncbi:MAG: hypothetical protein ACRD2L_12790 [Terriglobia bacterium]
MKASLAILLLGFALGLSGLAGCGGPQRDIVGKWSTGGDTSAMVWEFSKDGSVLVGITRGRYSFGDNNRVKIQTAFATSVYQMEFLTDRMILKDPSGSRLEFTRSK